MSDLLANYVDENSKKICLNTKLEVLLSRRPNFNRFMVGMKINLFIVMNYNYFFVAIKLDLFLVH